MSPRGVVTPDVRERLFSAAERVLAAGGSSALTSRAVTTEAGCAKGLIHNHFAGLDEFIADLTLDRMARTVRAMEPLAQRAGQNTVAENLLFATQALIHSPGPLLGGLAAGRPAAFARVRAAMESGAPGFSTAQELIADYLRAERALGRIPEHADTATMAMTLAGTVHHLLMTGPVDGLDITEQTERLVTLLLSTFQDRAGGAGTGEDLPV
ncbi:MULTISPECIES: TetR/AcrR family transcriptional regulator [unclassified Streptomyces]|uniref:TetR/AcrR family transcriptional regulator n=1 Tax=unclassified Streptomyces TaxID=2593676 RepID=UPI00068544EE|nr:MULTISPECIES: TetR/AcrR family transcriptional regulator [unclassified Streptomyces]MYY02579.1 TetR family transcriptional regulator [Streptomyces sp. SID4913]